MDQPLDLSSPGPAAPAPPPYAAGPSPPAGSWTPEQDLEHLRLLSIFHYLAAALVAFCTLVPVFHLMMMFSAVYTSILSERTDVVPTLVVSSFFLLFGGTWILFGTALGVCLILGGRYLAEQSHYTFCLVAAGVACVFMPLGTVLGVFTLLVLLRPSVRARFGAAPPFAASSGGPAGRLEPS